MHKNPTTKAANFSAESDFAIVNMEDVIRRVFDKIYDSSHENRKEAYESFTDFLEEAKIDIDYEKVLIRDWNGSPDWEYVDGAFKCPGCPEMTDGCYSKECYCCGDGVACCPECSRGGGDRIVCSDCEGKGSSEDEDEEENDDEKDDKDQKEEEDDDEKRGKGEESKDPK